MVFLSAPAWAAGNAVKCGPGQIGPVKTIITMYVSHKQDDEESLSKSSRKKGPDGKWKGKFCDQHGAGDQSARDSKWGPPSKGRYKGSPDGQFSGAIPQGGAYLGRNFQVMNGKYQGLKVFANDHIGTPNGSAVSGSAVPQIDLSTTCDEYEKNTEGVTKDVQICIDAEGGTPAGLEAEPKRHSTPQPRPARRQR